MATRKIHVHGTAAQPGDPDLFWRLKYTQTSRIGEFRSGVIRSHNGTTFWSPGTTRESQIWVHIAIQITETPLPRAPSLPKKGGLMLDDVTVFFDTEIPSLEAVRVSAHARLLGEVKRSVSGEHRVVSEDNTFRFEQAGIQHSSVNVALGLRYPLSSPSPIGKGVDDDGNVVSVGGGLIEGSAFLLRGVTATISGDV